MQARAESWEFINCHVQEIPENGADWKHFEYVHFYLFEFLVPWLKFAWRPLSSRGNSPNFNEIMA